VSRIGKMYVSFAKEPNKRDDILQKRPIIESMLLTVATPDCLEDTGYGVAAVSRIDSIIGLFCKRTL